MSSIGETLRRERIRRNLDLEQISRELKISARFLEAIEDERFDRLPAGVFARSFVRQYAALLGFDGDELAAEIQQVLEPPAPAEPVSPGVPPVDIHVPRVEQWEAVGDHRGRDWSSSLPAAALVVVVMLVCSGVYAFWQRARHPVSTATQAAPAQSAPASAPVAAVPPQPAALQPEPQTPSQPPAQDQPRTEPGAPVNPEPATVAQTPKPAPPAAPAANPPAQPSPAAAPPNEAARLANPNAPVRVQLSAAEPVWVLVRADGKYIFSGTLDANQTRSVDANEAVTLRLGNAGGINITLNGKSIGAVGPKGQVREIQLTSGGFHIVAAPKPSLPLDNPI